MIRKILLSGLLIFILSNTSSFGQTLKSGGWEISIDTMEMQQLEIFGAKQTIYFGILSVKQKRKGIVKYRFYLPEVKGKPGHLTIRDMGNNILEPRLYFNASDSSFTIHPGTDKEAKEVAVLKGNTKELVLSGMLIWLRRKD